MKIYIDIDNTICYYNEEFKGKMVYSKPFLIQKE